MPTKLTLTVDKEIIELAKSYARLHGRSLSDLIENYLKSLVKNDHPKNELSPKVRRLLGAVKLPENADYNQEILDAVSSKHLL